MQQEFQKKNFQIYQSLKDLQKQEQEVKNYFEGVNTEILEKYSRVKLRKLLGKNFLKNLDVNLRFFCRRIRESLRELNYEVIAVTGYPGVGKSQLTSLLGCLIDKNYSFARNICFIPTAEEVEKKYLGLKPYSFLHIDEASRSIHKHKWYEKTQQKLVTLYDTERENHYLATAIIMPRFQNLTENFRNFFVKYWINIIARGVAIVYKRDEDKDRKDPWNCLENIKMKEIDKKYERKKIFERTISEIIRAEQRTKNYLFYFVVPEMNHDVWKIYRYLKFKSRNELYKEDNIDYEKTKENKKIEKYREIVKLLNEGKSVHEIAILIKHGTQTIRDYIKEIEAYNNLYSENEDFDESLRLNKYENKTNEENEIKENLENIDIHQFDIN